MQQIKQKIIQIKDILLNYVSNFKNAVNNKMALLVPNEKIRKFLYYFIISFFAFVIVIILLGSLYKITNDFSKSKNTKKINPLNSTSSTPSFSKGVITPEKKLLMELTNKINDLEIPQSELNIISIEKELSIEYKDN